MTKRSKILIAAAALLCIALSVAAVLLYMYETELEAQEQQPVETAAPVEPEPEPCGVGKIVINEFMEKNRTTVKDMFGGFSDWIELKNISAEDVDITGFQVGDRETRLWRLPERTLKSGETLLIFASGRDVREEELHTSFSISGKETLYLKNADGVLCDTASCMECEADVSVVRLADGSREKSVYASPGFENDREGYEGFRRTQQCAGPIQINEVMVSNQRVFGNPADGYHDWGEIKNISGSSVQLSNYWLSDSDKDYHKWRLPEYELAPGEIFTVIFDGEWEYFGSLPRANFSLNSEYEKLYLSSADGPIDYVCLRDIPYEGSYGRTEGREGWFYYLTPTPEKENTGGVRRIPEAPTALTKDGIYNDVASVSVEFAGEGTIRYTLDGSLPNEKSEKYKKPIVLTETSAVRAVCFDSDGTPSRATTQTYIINEYHDLPVVSLTTDSPYDFDGTYWGSKKGWEEPGSLSLYEQDGGSFTIGCGVSLNGETSLVLLKKNMSLRFRGAYGAQTLNYDIYGGGVTEFTNLLLRSGQDYEYAIVRNELCQALCARATDNVINQRSIWCALYINGEYWGLYTLKEKANEQLYASLAGVSPKSVEVIEANAPYESQFYQNIVLYCAMNDMRLDKNYEYICSKIDIDSLIDWTIMESFCANVDLTAGNLRYCRSSENDGKWRLMFYDLDSTFSAVNGSFENLLSDYAYLNRQVSTILWRVKDNEKFRDKFLTRAAELFSTVLTDEAVLEELDRQSAIVEREVERDITRYTRTMESWEANKQSIRDFIAGRDSGESWRQYNIDILSYIFKLSEQERAHYFGAIDEK